MWPLLWLLLTSPLLGDSDWYDQDDDYLEPQAPPPGFCCQTASRPREPGLCASNTSCVVADLDGSISSSDNCLISDDLKFENSFNRFLSMSIRLSTLNTLLHQVGAGHL